MLVKSSLTKDDAFKLLEWAKVAYENPNNNQLKMYTIIASTNPDNYISELGDLYKQVKLKFGHVKLQLALEDMQSNDIHKAHEGFINYFELSKKNLYDILCNEKVSEEAETLISVLLQGNGVESVQDNVQQAHTEVGALGATTPESDFIIINS
jgi:hypothetical protein